TKDMRIKPFTNLLETIMRGRNATIWLEHSIENTLRLWDAKSLKLQTVGVYSSPIMDAIKIELVQVNDRAASVNRICLEISGCLDQLKSHCDAIIKPNDVEYCRKNMDKLDKYRLENVRKNISATISEIEYSIDKMQKLINRGENVNIDVFENGFRNLLTDLRMSITKFGGYV
ncbi:hypothetical protein BC936DRAFT_142359, partial [Jimgerdemannia flammicorona]